MIDDHTIDHIAKLSRLRFEGTEREEIRQDLQKIVAFFDQLSEVDTTGVEPLLFPNEAYFAGSDGHNIEPLTQKEALKNAPEKHEAFFVVPKVL